MVATAIRTLPLTLLRVQAALTARPSIRPLSMVQMAVPVQETIVARMILDREVEEVTATVVVDPVVEVDREAVVDPREDVVGRIVEVGEDRADRGSPEALAARGILQMGIAGTVRCHLMRRTGSSKIFSSTKIAQRWSVTF